MIQTVRFKNLQIDIHEGDGRATYRFAGDIDEYFQHTRLQVLQHAPVVFDLAGIQNFNSIGIREWTRFVASFPKSVTLELINVSVSMVDQINMVPECLGRGVVISFFAPYYCECGNDSTRLLQVSEHVSDISALRAPKLACRSCGRPLEFDALEESYFSAILGTMHQAS